MEIVVLNFYTESLRLFILVVSLALDREPEGVITYDLSESRMRYTNTEQRGEKVGKGLSFALD